MDLSPSDLEVSVVEDRPKSGMWHCGPNACWIRVVHVPTQQSVTVYSERGQFKAREKARLLLELALDGWDGQPCSFPERVKEL